MRNLGPDTATDVTLTDMLPEGVTLASARPTQGSCDQRLGTVTCDVGTIGANRRVNVSITMVPLVAGSIANTVVVTGTQEDPDLSNNSDTETTAVR